MSTVRDDPVERLAGRTARGYESTKGIRIDSSYMKRLSNQPWVAEKKPWSEA